MAPPGVDVLLFGHLGFTFLAWVIVARVSRAPSAMTRRAAVLVLIGAILPDLVDKPLGYVLLPSLQNGQLVGHMLAFALILGLATLRPRWRAWILPIAFGVCAHQVEDQMWLNSTIWLWPLGGAPDPAPFPLSNYSDQYLLDRAAQLHELAGLAAFAMASWISARQWFYPAGRGGTNRP